MVLQWLVMDAPDDDVLAGECGDQFVFVLVVDFDDLEACGDWLVRVLALDGGDFVAGC